jgi:hypothetical protein
MGPVFGYSAATIAILLVAFWNRRRLKLVTYEVLRYSQNTWRYLQYKQIVVQHEYLGPWTAAEILLHILYLSANLIGVFYPPVSVLGLTTRSGAAAFVNISLLYCSPNVDLLSEIFGVTPKTWRQMHRAVAWMGGGLVALHFICALSQGSFGKSGRANHIGSVLVSVAPVHWSHLTVARDPRLY